MSKGSSCRVRFRVRLELSEFRLGDWVGIGVGVIARARVGVGVRNRIELE